MNRLLSLLNLREEKGATLVIVAISIVTLLGFGAIAIDGGKLYLEKSKLQNALDAAVLAGAQRLVIGDSAESKLQAETIAKDISQKNGFELRDNEITETVPKSHISATKSVSVPLTFAKVLGINSANVSASAKAIVTGPINSTEGVAPIAVEKGLLPNEPNGQSITLTCTGNENNQSGHNSPGNCGFLRMDADQNGADDLNFAIKNGSKGTIVSGITEVKTETGNMHQKVAKAVNEGNNNDMDSLLNSDKNKSYCNNWATADNSCKRVIVIAVINTWQGVNGNDDVKIIGLAAFWVEGYDEANKSLTGKFISTVNPGKPGGGSNNGLYVVKLAE